MGKPNPHPNLAHLQVFGCKAYPYIAKEQHLRTDKLSPRASIGYLVGYDSSNIYHVWIPSTGIVISSRDVTFDETTRYSGKQFTDEQLKEKVEYIVNTIGVHRTNEESSTRTHHLESELQEGGDEQESLGNDANKGGILYKVGVTPPHLGSSSERQLSPPSSPFLSPLQTPENRGGMAVYDTSAMIGNENQQATTVEKLKTCCTKVSCEADRVTIVVQTVWLQEGRGLLLCRPVAGTIGSAVGLKR